MVGGAGRSRTWAGVGTVTQAVHASGERDSQPILRLVDSVMNSVLDMVAHPSTHTSSPKKVQRRLMQQLRCGGGGDANVVLTLALVPVWLLMSILVSRVVGPFDVQRSCHQTGTAPAHLILLPTNRHGHGIRASRRVWMLVVDNVSLTRALQPHSTSGKSTSSTHATSSRIGGGVEVDEGTVCRSVCGGDAPINAWQNVQEKLIHSILENSFLRIKWNKQDIIHDFSLPGMEDLRFLF